MNLAMQGHSFCSSKRDERAVGNLQVTGMKRGNPNWKKGQSANPAKQFKPGQSGNPGGRPKKKPLTEAYERILLRPGEADRVAKAMHESACCGDVRAAIEMADRVEGKVTQPIGGDANAEPIRVVIERIGGTTAKISAQTGAV